MIKEQKQEKIRMKVKASYHQERLWFINEFETGNLYEFSPTYHNIPIILEIKGNLYVGPLEKSFLALIKRHEALHTRIITRKDAPLQWIDPGMKFKLEKLELKSKEENLSEEALNLALNEVKRPFNLDKEPLIRAHLIRIHKTSYWLAIAVHHTVCDRYSQGIIISELVQSYDAYSENHSPQLPPLKIQYADFAQWQADLPSKTLDPLLFYWKRQLGGHVQPLHLPTDHPRASVHIYQDEKVIFEIPREISASVEPFCQEHEVEESSLLLAVLKVLFHRYNSQEEIVVGTSTMNRDQAGIENVVGPIANLLVIRSIVKENSDFIQVLKDVHKNLEKAIKSQHLPFDRLVQELNPEKDMSRTALFDVLFKYEEEPIEEYPSKTLSVKAIETNLGWGKYDINLLIQKKECLSGILVYNKEYYLKSTIERMKDHYLILLKSVMENPEQPISHIPLLTEKEKTQILEQWNNTCADFPRDKTIHQIFREQAHQEPHRISICYHQQHMTYSQLDQGSDKVALSIRRENPGSAVPGTLIGVLVPRSEKMIMTLLGILKSGGVYLPMDPDYPTERIQYLLKDSSCDLIMTTKQDKQKIGDTYTGKILEQDAETIWCNACLPDSESGIEASPNDAAYVIYTSGTTGFPKGCIVTHRNVVRLIKNHTLKERYAFGKQDVWIMAHSYCFDFSVWEMYGALLEGGSLVIPDWEEVRDTHQFLTILKREAVTVLNQTPLSFINLIEAEKRSPKKNLHHHLRYVIFGGDKLTPQLLNDWNSLYPLSGIQLINMFGITETTVHVTHYRLREQDVLRKETVSPIGNPLPETLVYIVDKHMNLVTAGIPGEMVVGGKGVARGYLNRVQLTTERFLQNPFQPGEELYRTGDLGKWDPNGGIEYLGRNDDQVKIRGYRIELGEIKSRILDHPEILEVEILAYDASRENPDKNTAEITLCAFYVSGTELKIIELKERLSIHLPQYMIPTFFTRIDRIPLTQNGKVDKSSLPLPFGQIDTGVEFVEPRNEVEKVIVNIWKEVLKLDKISIYDSFFDLGGTSIKIIHVMNAFKEAFNREFPIFLMFQYTTVDAFARYMTEGESKEENSVIEKDRNKMENRGKNKLKKLKKKMKDN
jgi:amino acid adenylation domain-containing protein